MKQSPHIFSRRPFAIIAAFALSLFLSACAGGGFNSTAGVPGGINSGVVTSDPNAIPNIAWQTNGQRQGLYNTQNDPSRPALQTVVGDTAVRDVKVALILPLTGKQANLGQSMLKAAQMALFDVGSAHFELVPQDTQGLPDGAAAAARAAVAQNVDLILGPVFSDDVKQVKPIAAAANIPVVAFSTDWTLADNNTYVMGFLPFMQVARATRYAADHGFTRIGVLAPQTDYCDIVIDTLHRIHTNVVAEQRYAPQQPDLSAVVGDFVTRNRGADGKLAFDSLLLPLGSEGLRSLTSMLDQKGIRAAGVKLLGTGLWDDASLTTNPVVYGGWFAAPDPKSRADFERRYTENFGEAPLRLSTLAYDSTALAAVLARTTPTGDKTYSHAQMTNPRGFAGIDGVFRFRPDGMSERGLAILEVQSGRLKVIDPAPTAFISSGT